MKLTKQQLKQIIKEELSEIETDLGIARGPDQGELVNILKRLDNPQQQEQVKAALEQSGVFQLDPIEHKKAIEFIMNAHRQHADEVLDFILVKIANEVLKVSI